MRALLTITAKDLRLRSRDRSVYLIGLIVPLGLAFVLNAAMGGALDDQVTIELGVLDLDHGEVSEEFVTALSEMEGDVNIDVEVAEGSLDEVRSEVDGESLPAVIVVPEGFSAAATSPEASAETPRLEVIGNVNMELSTEVATAIAEGFATQVNAGRLAVATALSGPQPAPGDEPSGPPDVDDLVAEAMAMAPPVEIGQLPSTERTLDGTTGLMAGMTVLFLFFVVTFGVTGLLEERTHGTLSRLQAAPIHPLALVGAKALTSVLLGLASVLVLVLSSTWLMGADWGDPWAVLALSVAVVLAAISIMGVVAATARTPEQAGNYQSLIALTLAVMGGSFFPVALSDSDWLIRAASLTPHHWFLRGLGEAQAGGLSAALGPIAALLAFAVIVGGLGVLALRWRPVR